MTLPQPDISSGATSVGTVAQSTSAPWWLWVTLAVIGILALGVIGFGVSMARRPATVSGAGAPLTAAEAERRRREQAVRGLLTPHAPDANPPDHSE
jgi:hypothetical protein